MGRLSKCMFYVLICVDVLSEVFLDVLHLEHRFLDFCDVLSACAGAFGNRLMF